MADAHWAAALIGAPYQVGARGPHAFDCWGLLPFTWKMRLGIDVPDVRADRAKVFRETLRRGRYVADGCEAYEVSKPRELDAVYLTSQQQPHHVGLWVQPDALGGVLHAIEGAGVVFQRQTDLLLHGFSVVKFMRLQAAL